MDRSDSQGIVPRRWSDGQDSMQVAGFMKHGPAQRGRIDTLLLGGLEDG
jgi:hypothetical protein